MIGRLLPVFALLLGSLLPGAVQSAWAEVVVTRTGTVYQGEVIKEPSGAEAVLELRTPTGVVALVDANIRARGRSLPAVHEKLAAECETPAHHQALARWCVRHRLFTQAKTHLEKLNDEARAIETDAMRDARDRLEEQSKRPLPKAASRLPTMADDVAPRTTAAWHREIRPLLRNSCAMSGCHGAASDQAFRVLARNRPGEPTALEAALQRIDKGEPLESDLLRFARQPHGGAIRIATDPARSPQRYERLRQWVEQAAKADGIGRNARGRYELQTGFGRSWLVPE